jgi:hypothetical protein
MTGINLLHARGGRPRLNALPALTHSVAATVTGSVHLPGTPVRLLVTSAVTAPPTPDAAWGAPITSDARGNFTTSITPPATIGQVKVWVALAKNLKNMWGQTAASA